MTTPETPSLTWPPPWLRVIETSGASGRPGQPLAWPPPWLEAERAVRPEPAVAADPFDTAEVQTAAGPFAAARSEAVAEPESQAVAESLEAAGPRSTLEPEPEPEPEPVTDGPAARKPLDAEEQVILDLAKEWGAIDRTYRVLAYRGSYTERVFLPVANVRRILRKHRVRLPGEPPRPVRHTVEVREVPWEPNRIWMWEETRFPAADRIAHALVDVVSHYWLGFRLAVDELEVDREQLVAAALTELNPSGEDARVPILVSWSDGRLAPEEADGSTEHITVESLFSLIIGESPQLPECSDGDTLERELTRLRTIYNEVRLHPGIGYVTPADEHEGRGARLRSARRAGLREARLRREGDPDQPD